VFPLWWCFWLAIMSRYARQPVQIPVQSLPDLSYLLPNWEIRFWRIHLQEEALSVENPWSTSHSWWRADHNQIPIMINVSMFGPWEMSNFIVDKRQTLFKYWKTFPKRHVIPNGSIKILFNINRNDFLWDIHFSVPMISLFCMTDLFLTFKLFHLLWHCLSLEWRSLELPYFGVSAFQHLGYHLRKVEQPALLNWNSHSWNVTFNCFKAMSNVLKDRSEGVPRYLKI
jgi:hypothetical protein